MTLAIVRRLIPRWGTTYGPPGEGPFPAVLVLHGSEGGWAGWSHRSAVILAAHGFLVFPFAYSKGGNASNGRVGIYGISRGAEHALLLASLMARDGVAGLPDAVAAHSPADVVCGAFDGPAWRDEGDPGWRPWDPAERAWTWRGTSDDLLPTTPIEIERFNGPLFISHGTADTVWSVAMTQRLEARLKAAGKPAEVHYHEGEDHTPGSEAENRHHEQLLAFLARHLAVA